MKKTPCLLLPFIVFVLSWNIILPHEAGCSEAGERITFTDAFSKKVEIAAPAQRIVVINGDAAEILCALGAENNIVGISSHIAENRNLLSGLAGKAVVGSTTSPSLEKIIELQPDLVIAYEMWLSREAFEDKLSPLGIPVARLYCYRMDRLDQEIEILGKIVGKEERAASYTRYFHEILDHVNKRLEGRKGEKINIYNESYGPYKTITDGSGHESFLDSAGVENIAASQAVRFPEITAEWVVEKNPDLIVKVASNVYVKSGYGVNDVKAIEAFRDDLLKRPVWAEIAAVKNNRVYILSNELYVGPRAPLGILYISKWAYPELFQDVDPQELHRKWLMQWHGKALEGIYVYP